MVRVRILVREGALRFGVSVQAQSIRRAVEIAAARYPGADVQVSYPIDAGAFFVDEPDARVDLLCRELPHSLAA